MKTKLIAGSLLAAIVLTGCENPKQAVGTLGGGALGGWAGSGIGKGRGRVVATAVGAVAGALLGGEIGRHLDSQDKKIADLNASRTLENAKSGTVSTWKNPDSGHSGTFKPTRTYERQGRYCREFVQSVRIGGKVEEAYGTACRQPDGSWEMVR